MFVIVIQIGVMIAETHSANECRQEKTTMREEYKYSTSIYFFLAAFSADFVTNVHHE